MTDDTPGLGFEPRSPCGHRLSSARIDYKKVKKEFISYLNQKGLDYKTIKTLDNYLTKPITSQEDVFEIMQSCERGYNWLARSIRNLINFYVDVKGLDEGIVVKLKRACKMRPTGVKDIFISSDELLEAYSYVKEKQPNEIVIFFKLLVYSGIRATHAVEMLNTFNRSKMIVIEDKGIARYPILEFSKGQKKGFFAYISLSFVDELDRINLRYCQFIDRMRYGGVSPNTIRKWHYNLMIENGIPESVADFIQGRHPASVGAMHYLAVARQAYCDHNWSSDIQDPNCVHIKAGDSVATGRYMIFVSTSSRNVSRSLCPQYWSNRLFVSTED